MVVKYNSVDKAVKRAKEMIEEGVDIIDVGGTHDQDYRNFNGRRD